MNLRRRWLYAGAMGLGLNLAVLSARGEYFDDPCRNIPPGAQPAPPGTYLDKFIHVQTAKAEQDDFVFYKHMWYRGGTELGPLGRYQLDLMTRRLPTVPFPVVIETSKDDRLDAQRRDVIVQLLQARGFTDPDRVIVAFPIAEGLLGEDAFRIYNGLINVGPNGLNSSGAGYNPFTGAGLNNQGLGGFGSLPGFGTPGFGTTPGLGTTPGFFGRFPGF